MPKEYKPSSPRSAIAVVSGILVILTLVIFFFVSRGGNDGDPPEDRTTDSAPTAPIVAEFPTSGEGHATKEIGIKAYLDPQKTRVRPSRPARYVFVEDTVLFFDDSAGYKFDHSTDKEWWAMPEGKYIVYPLKDGDSIFFKWW